MNKGLAETIAGLIPDRMERNRWRGLLRYGPLRLWRLRRKLRKNLTSPNIDVAVCTIAKNEAPYLKEWVDYHLDKGVDKIYFYDNGSTDDTKEVLEPYIKRGKIEYNFYPGYRKQIAAYDDCMERHRLDTRWIAFIDIDEFIVPVMDASIKEFLDRLRPDAAVEINWLIYGSGGEKENTGEDVMKRFRYHSVGNHELNRHVKSIVNPRKVAVMAGCHEAARIYGTTVDSHGSVVVDNFKRREPQHDVIKINHYAVKSRGEFEEKKARGRASGKKRTVEDEYFIRYDLNDIKED